ncbi:MAG: hypothetical protein WB760_28225 [Xanthobacteraceae bacterium]
MPPWISIVGGLNALIFAFIIFTVWTNLHAASADVDSEALTVRMLWRDITPAQRPQVLAYSRAVIAGWSQLCGGKGIRRPAEFSTPWSATPGRQLRRCSARSTTRSTR